MLYFRLHPGHLNDSWTERMIALIIKTECVKDVTPWSLVDRRLQMFPRKSLLTFSGNELLLRQKETGLSEKYGICQTIRRHVPEGR